jgi:hypothetical protein
MMNLIIGCTVCVGHTDELEWLKYSFDFKVCTVHTVISTDFM